MESLKNVAKKFLGKYTSFRLSKIISIYSKYKDKNKKYTLLYCITNMKIINQKQGKANQINNLFSKVRLDRVEEKNFYYYIDIFTRPYAEEKVLGNLTLDYAQILDKSLEDFREDLKLNKVDKNFYDEEIITIQAIENFIDRITSFLEQQQSSKEIITNLQNIKNNKAKTFKEALQRILFYNQLMWQTGHTLNGLGRLDFILEKYYLSDINENKLTKSEAKELIREFIKILHKDYYFKSSALSGDTGQIIEIGGTSIQGKYEYNELTYMFIDVIKELQLPDPKLLLRVSNNTPRELVEKAIDCVQTGIGCPLFANDDVIIQKLIDFGYEECDAFNYVTSACWEPFFAGKSLDQNNEDSIVFLEPFENLLNNEEVKSFDELINKYELYLEKYLKEKVKLLNSIKYEKDPLLTLFYEDCIKNNKDISNGGAKYNNTGLTGVSLSNLVNSLLNVKYFVFEKKEIPFEDLNKMRKENFNEKEEWVAKLKDSKLKYGSNEDEVIDLTNRIIKKTTDIILKYKNQFGGNYKFGLSAPTYIMKSKDFPASFDGRKNGEPFGVHISSDSPEAYTDLFQFASKIDYNENRFNGNVIDFFVTPNFIKDNFEKFVDFIVLCIKLGFFEMQMNVVSSKTLIEARKNPEKFPKLIVRVWGFSAYFNDLPDEYKDYLIERALKSEGNSN